MKRLRRLRLDHAVLVLALCTTAVAGTTTITGKVIGVSDGDTITIFRDGNSQKIRLHGIDCPERGQDYGAKAKKFTADLVFGDTVSVDVVDRDRYGRSVGTVILSDGRNLNYELVRAGMAWWYREYSDDDSLRILEQQAREARRGLWAKKDPIPPWEYRKSRRSH